MKLQKKLIVGLEIKEIKMNNLFLLKIRIWITRNKSLLFIIIFSLVLYSFNNIIRIFNNVDLKLTETQTGVFFTLLGTIIGGSMSILSASSTTNYKIKSESEIKIKSTIYRPLYDEVVFNKNIFLKTNSFPKIEFGISRQTARAHPQVDAWERISNDSRIFDTPRILKERLYALDSKYRKYNDCREKINDYVNPIINNKISQYTRSESKTQNLGDFLFSNIMDENVTYIKNSILPRKESEKEGLEVIIQEIIHEVKNLPQVKEIVKERKLLLTEINETISMLEILISYINVKFERKDI